MHEDPSIVIWPDYQEFRCWLETEVHGLSDAQLDFDSQDPGREWMWWSIRRQVSHVAWVFLAVMRRRCHTFLWPDGDIPTPIRWEDHNLANMKSDRRLDEEKHWEIEDLLDKARLGAEWAAQVVDTVPVETLRATQSVHRATAFWKHVIQVLPRGATVEPDDPDRIRYTLEASLWMLYWEVLAHLFTIQRLKQAQGLDNQVTIPRVGYLTLPEYTGESEEAAPAFVPLT